MCVTSQTANESRVSQRVASPRVRPTVTSVKSGKIVSTQPQAFKNPVSLANYNRTLADDPSSACKRTGTTHQRAKNAYDLR